MSQRKLILAMQITLAGYVAGRVLKAILKLPGVFYQDQ